MHYKSIRRCGIALLAITWATGASGFAHGADPSPANVTVTARRLAKPCGERDAACIQTIAKEVWAKYPSRIETYCAHSKMAKESERLLADQLADAIGLNADNIDYEIPRALKAVCDYHAQQSDRLMAVDGWLPWTNVPSQADLAAAYPKGAAARGDGEAQISCAVTTKGRLGHCLLASEFPDHQGFGKAALTLANKFAVKADPDTASRLGQLTIDVAIHFSDPKTPGGAPRVLTDPDWIRLPDPAAAAPLYPAAARAAAVTTGVGRVDCTVGETGTLGACRLLDETPAALGFGAAALAAAQQLRMNLWTRDGQRSAGSHIVIPLRFNLPATAAEPLQAPAG